MESLIYVLISTGLAGLLFAFWKATEVEKQEEGTETMIYIGKKIAKGGIVFLKTELKAISILLGAVSILLYLEGRAAEMSNGFVAVSFIVGAALSLLSGYLGMRTAQRANVRTANASRSSVDSALQVAFGGGSVMGIGTISLGIIGIGGLFLFYQSMEFAGGVAESMNLISGFLLGASLVSLVTRVNGGIFSKASDLSADSQMNSANDIPSDQIFNPASTLDYVGDTIKAVKGTGSDIFESFAASIVAAMILGTTFLTSDEFVTGFQTGTVLLPLVLGGAGILITALTTFFVRIREGQNPRTAFNKAEWVGFFATVIASYFIVRFVLPQHWIIVTETANQTIQTTYTSMGIFWSVLTGIVAGALICVFTEISTGIGSRTVSSVISKSTAGSSANVLAGLVSGMRSTFFPVLVIIIGIIVSYQVGGFYGISMAAVGMLSSAGIRTAIDTYGAISENAGDIAQLSNLPAETQLNIKELESVGNNTFGVNKGFAIGAGIMAGIAMLAAFFKITGIENINLTAPSVVAALFFGAVLPMLFSSAVIDSVSKTAEKISEEVKRQFASIPELANAAAIVKKYNGLTENANEEEKLVLEAANEKADSEKCIQIGMNASINESIYPILAAILFPIVFAYFGGGEILGSFLLGATVSGIALALFSTNAGLAWSNAKKMVENGLVVDDTIYGKGSELHLATVTGDTIGDPLKDASGSAITVFVKFMIITALVMAPGLNSKPLKSQIKEHVDISAQKSIQHIIQSNQHRVHTISKVIVF